jgi:hypothetical protein
MFPIRVPYVPTSAPETPPRGLRLDLSRVSAPSDGGEPTSALRLVLRPGAVVCLRDAVEQPRWRHFQRPGELDDGCEPRIAC